MPLQFLTFTAKYHPCDQRRKPDFRGAIPVFLACFGLSFGAIFVGNTMWAILCISTNLSIFTTCVLHLLEHSSEDQYHKMRKLDMATLAAAFLVHLIPSAEHHQWAFFMVVGCGLVLGLLLSIHPKYLKWMVIFGGSFMLAAGCILLGSLCGKAAMFCCAIALVFYSWYDNDLSEDEYHERSVWICSHDVVHFFGALSILLLLAHNASLVL